MEQKKVRMNDDNLEFDEIKIPRTQKCGFRISSEGCIDIGSVWYMFKEISGDRAYTQEVARKRGFKYIGVAHRGDLCDYLVGRLSTCAGLVQDVIEGKKRPADERDEPKAQRRRLNRAQAAGGEAKPKAREYKVGDLTATDVSVRVRPVQDLDVLVRCPGRTVPNAELILKIAQDEINNWNRLKRDVHRPDANLAGRLPLIKELEKLVTANQMNRPIILVPCNKQAPVNILNAQRFLQDGQYFRPDSEHVRNFESTRAPYVEVCRNIDNRLWTFEVRDTAANFTKAQWLRVVAVVADGTAWQFSGWPFANVVDLFTTCKGVYFNPVNQLCPLHVREWAVAQLQMHPVQFQHRFSEVRDAFWVEVEKFLGSTRQKKYANHTTLETVQLSGKKPLPVL